MDAKNASTVFRRGRGDAGALGTSAFAPIWSSDPALAAATVRALRVSSSARTSSAAFGLPCAAAIWASITSICCS